ncbi:MAG: DUF2807 domain-containing protein [Anaerolineales bacterium]|nr:MAG: DUF2807 domain-containing protein [Anaerolineales bacterium]
MSRMRFVLLAVVLLVTAVVVTGCCPWCTWITDRRVELTGLRGSGRLVTRELDFEGFTRLEISHAFEVDLVQSRSYSVVITADDNVIDDVEVTMSRDTLRIGMKRLFLNFQGVTLRAEVSMPTLEALELSGASRLTGSMEADDIGFDISGASRLTLRGGGAQMRLDASGASQIDLSAFVVDDADVDISGASQATVNVRGRLDAEASGASQLEYLGNPSMGRIETSGASSISPAR